VKYLYNIWNVYSVT